MRTRSEQIDDMLRQLEHIWKMNSALTFQELLSKVTPQNSRGGLSVAPLWDDQDWEASMRDYLQRVMKRARDET